MFPCGISTNPTSTPLLKQHDSRFSSSCSSLLLLSPARLLLCFATCYYFPTSIFSSPSTVVEGTMLPGQAYRALSNSSGSPCPSPKFSWDVAASITPSLSAAWHRSSTPSLADVSNAIPETHAPGKPPSTMPISSASVALLHAAATPVPLAVTYKFQNLNPGGRSNANAIETFPTNDCVLNRPPSAMLCSVRTSASMVEGINATYFSRSRCATAMLDAPSVYKHLQTPLLTFHGHSNHNGVSYANLSAHCFCVSLLVSIHLSH